MLSYPSGLPVSTRALTLLAEALRQRRQRIGSSWRRLTPGRQALLVLAHLRKGERYADLAAGFDVGIATVHRYVHEALAVLAAMTPTLQHAVTVAAAKAYVVLDGTLLRIDRVAMATKGDRIYYSGKHKAHGLNVQTLADPAGRLIWASPALPGSRHDINCAREHGLLTALAGTGVPVLADRGYQGAARTCPEVRVPQRSRRKDRTTGAFRPLSANQRAVNRAHAALRAPGERANAQLKSWRVLRKIRSSPTTATGLVAAVQTLILAG
ncbi:transposase family protein [Kineococcus arenarius]|uniref:transposase family protein n=1 Tax=unclassified Kineococcus TaxID=2621656 RepID=UPI003D7D50C4